MFGALDDEERAPIYYTNALVYILPWLSRGFELDAFSIACLVACVIHIQVTLIDDVPSAIIVERNLDSSKSIAKCAHSSCAMFSLVCSVRCKLPMHPASNGTLALGAAVLCAGSADFSAAVHPEDSLAEGASLSAGGAGGAD